VVPREHASAYAAVYERGSYKVLKIE